MLSTGARVTPIITLARAEDQLFEETMHHVNIIWVTLAQGRTKSFVIGQWVRTFKTSDVILGHRKWT